MQLIFFALLTWAMISPIKFEKPNIPLDQEVENETSNSKSQS